MSDNGLIVDKEFKSLLPPHTEEEHANLVASLKEEGCRDKLVVWKGHNIILDGMNRYPICERRGIGFQTKAIDLPDRRAARIWIITNQLSRRNLTDFARTEIALKLKDEIAAQAAEREKAAREAANAMRAKSAPGGAARQDPDDSSKLRAGQGKSERTDEAVGEIAGVSRDIVRKVETALGGGTEKLIAAARAGKISSAMAADAAKHACHELQDALADEIITKEQFAEIRKGYPPLRQVTALQRLLAQKKTERQPGEDEDEHRGKANAPRESKTSVEDVSLPLASRINKLAASLRKAKVFAVGQLAPDRVTQIVRHLARNMPAKERSDFRVNVMDVAEAMKQFEKDMEDWK